MKVLLSIKPEFVQKIFSGEKKYEFRKILFKRKGITTVVVYSTMPIGQIVGEFEIEEILNDSPNVIWKKTKKYSGIDDDFFNSYYKGKSRAVAIKIKNPILYKDPINPLDKYDKFVAPQSYKYLD